MRLGNGILGGGRLTPGLCRRHGLVGDLAIAKITIITVGIFGPAQGVVAFAECRLNSVGAGPGASEVAADGEQRRAAIDVATGGTLRLLATPTRLCVALQPYGGHTVASTGRNG